MSTANEQLHDAAINHAVDLQKYSNGVVRRIIAILNRTDPDLFAQLTAALERLDGQSFTVERLDMLLQSVRALNAQAYAQIGRELTQEMRDLVDYEAGAQAQMFQQALPVQMRLNAVSVEQAYAAAMSRPFQGRLLREWTQSIEADRMARIRDAVRIGFVEGQTTAEIVRRVRGTRAKGYSDGIIEIDRRNAESVVRTAVSHTAGTARDQFFDGNVDLIKALSWTSTLDSRTSEICRVRDGKQYTPGTHKPIGHQFPWLGGPGRAHWQCRSCSVPVLKIWKELTGADVPEFSPAARAAMDGQVPADMTYAEWLKKQSAARQDEILGPTRGAMFRSGDLAMERFYNDKGTYLTLTQLRAREPRAFRNVALHQPTGEFTIYDPGFPRRSPDVSTPARKAAVRIEDEIRRDSLETGVFIGADGQVQLRKQGQPDRVGFTHLEMSRMEGATFTHNHPGNGTFSPMDVAIASDYRLAELRAVGPTLRFRMAPKEGWPSAREIADEIEKIAPSVLKTVENMVARGDLDRRFVQAEIDHIAWLRVSRKFGLGYTREKS